MSHTRISIGVAENGSVQIASRSGFRIMSDSLIAFHPAIEEPSNMKPSVKLSSSTTPDAIVKCCHLPLGSVKRRSTHSISSSLSRDRILPASFAMLPSVFLSSFPRNGGPSDLLADQKAAGLPLARK